MVNLCAYLGILSAILSCEDALFTKRCRYTENCSCGRLRKRFTVSTMGCASLLGKCQLDCPKGLLSLDLGSTLRNLGLNLYLESVCRVFENCEECNPIGFNCTACPHFKYGTHCNKDCICKNAISCQQNGRCICKEGFKGDKCQQKISCIPPDVQFPLQQSQYLAFSPVFINYTCPRPYHLIGSTEIQCINGKWNNPPPKCVVMCQNPPVPRNGGVKGIQGNNIEVGTNAIYFCHEEYNLIGNEMTTCNHDGKWNKPPPVCVKLKLCDDLGNVLNAQREERVPVKISGSNFPVDSVIVYTCKEGFLMDGNSAITCQEDQNWSSNLPKCFKVAETSITCHTKANEIIDEIGVPVRINCPPGCVRNNGEVWGTVIYKINSSVCSASIHSEKIENTGGSVYVVNYGKSKDFLGSNINGIFSKSSSQRSNSFKLEQISPPGTDLTGRIKGCPDAWHQVEEQCIFVIQDHKTWNISQYVCQNMGGHIVVLNNRLTQEMMPILEQKGISSAWVGLRRNFGKFKWIGTSEEIANGVWTSGEPREDCVAINVNDGKWESFSCNNRLPFICAIDLMAKKKASCTLPEPILNGKIDYEEIEGEVLEGVTIAFRCDKFHEVSGSSNITCTESGKWNHPPPKCIKMVMCEKPPSPAYGVVEISTTQTLALSRSALSSGRSLTGNFPTPLNANPPNIQSPRNNIPSNRNISLPDGFYPVGSLASYKCLSRYYKLVGSKTRRCQKDNVWSGRPAICIPVCGRSDSKRAPFILNGNATEIGQWPWQVGLARLVPEYNVWFIFCGGALLNEHWVITAAHCVTVSGTTTLGSPDNYRVYLGKYHRDDKLDDDAVQISKVKEVHVHPDFDPHLFDADIALLLLDKPVTLTSRVQPVCLPTGITTRNNIVEGSLGVVTGWGLNENKSYAQQLQQAVLPVVSHKQCEKGYEDAKLPLTVTENMYCAGVAESTVDVCSGDSGGPMVFPDDDGPERQWILEGIVSWGSPSGCGFANQYGGFTKVNNYNSWIQKFI